jgi:PilZ domain-containing protein
MAILGDAPRRRSQRVAQKKRGRLVVNNQKLLPCIVVDSSKEGFRLRASVRARRGDMVEVILDEPDAHIEQCSVVWIGKPDTKEFGEVGLEIVRVTPTHQREAYL